MDDWASASMAVEPALREHPCGFRDACAPVASQMIARPQQHGGVASRQTGYVEMDQALMIDILKYPSGRCVDATRAYWMLIVTPHFPGVPATCK